MLKAAPDMFFHDIPVLVSQLDYLDLRRWPLDGVCFHHLLGLKTTPVGQFEAGFSESINPI
jgi:hypothetical protein